MFASAGCYVRRPAHFTINPIHNIAYDTDPAKAGRKEGFLMSTSKFTRYAGAIVLTTALCAVPMTANAATSGFEATSEFPPGSINVTCDGNVTLVADDAYPGNVIEIVVTNGGNVTTATKTSVEIPWTTTFGLSATLVDGPISVAAGDLSFSGSVVGCDTVTPTKPPKATKAAKIEAKIAKAKAKIEAKIARLEARLAKAKR